MNKIREIRKKAEESGFTLIEVLIGVVIVGILVSIAYPIWTNIQNQQHESAVKQKLAQVAVQIEQESIDNNGYIPKYVPNEVLNDEIAKDFTYEHKERLNWCVTARVLQDSLFPFQPPTASVWFVSSENITPTKTNVCGGPGYEPMEGSSEPWDTPVIVAPQITNHVTAWPNTSSNANLSATYSPGSCTLSSSDTDLFTPGIELRYRVEVQNLHTGRTGTTISTGLTGSTTSTIASMNGFYPGDPYQIRVQSVCTVRTNEGFPYEYYSNWSEYSNGTVATFVVPAPTWNALSFNVGTGNSSTANRFSGSWSSPYVCPTGSSKRYTVDVTFPGATTLPTQTLATTSTSLSNQTLTQNRPGYRHDFGLKAICDFSASGVNVNVSSANANKQLRSPLRAPTGTLSVGQYTSPENSVSITPSGFSLNRASGSQFACAAGNAVATMTARDASGVNYNSRTVAFGSTADFFSEIITRNSVNKNLTVSGTVLCSGIVDGLMQTSPVSANTASGTFMIRYKIPSIPANPTGFWNDSGGSASYNNDRLGWTATTCKYGAVPQYQVRQMQKSSKTVYAAANRPAVGGTHTTNSVKLTNTQIGAGSTVKFEVRSRCTNSNGSSAWTPYTTGAGATWTTTIPKPGVPGGRSFSGVGTGKAKWNAVTCAAGSTAKYYAQQTKRHTTNVTQVFANWQTGRTANFGSNWRQGATIAWRVKARCDGPDRNSAQGSYGTHSAVSSISGPTNPHVWHPGYGWIFQVRGTCPATGVSATGHKLSGWTAIGVLPTVSTSGQHSWAGHWAAGGGYAITGEIRCSGPSRNSAISKPVIRWGV